MPWIDIFHSIRCISIHDVSNGSTGHPRGMEEGRDGRSYPTQQPQRKKSHPDQVTAPRFYSIRIGRPVPAWFPSDQLGATTSFCSIRVSQQPGSAAPRIDKERQGQSVQFGISQPSQGSCIPDWKKTNGCYSVRNNQSSQEQPHSGLDCRQRLQFSPAWFNNVALAYRPK